MPRSIGTALVGTVVLAASAGCAYQDPFSLPDLAARGTSPSMQVYPSYGLGYGYGYRYGYGYGAGYPNVYQPGYGYANPYFAAQGPYPYGYGYLYSPSPGYVVVPCADSDRDGQCDARPPKQRHDRDQHDHDAGSDDQPAQPRRAYHDEVPRVRTRARDVASATPRQQSAPAASPVVQPPARVRPEPRRATPPEAASQRGPRAGSVRPSTTGNDVSSSRPTQEP